MEKLALTVADIGQALGVSLPVAYKLANREDFPSFKVGKRIIIPTAAFQEWLKSSARDRAEYSDDE